MADRLKAQMEAEERRREWKRRYDANRKLEQRTEVKRWLSEHPGQDIHDYKKIHRRGGVSISNYDFIRYAFCIWGTSGGRPSIEDIKLIPRETVVKHLKAYVDNSEFYGYSTLTSAFIWKMLEDNIRLDDIRGKWTADDYNGWLDAEARLVNFNPGEKISVQDLKRIKHIMKT